MMNFSTKLSPWLGLCSISLLAGLLSACEKPLTTDSIKSVAQQVTTPAASGKPSNAKPTYANELSKLNEGINYGVELMTKQPRDTLLALEVVSMYQERAMLTGNYDDYTKADALLATLSKESRLPASVCVAQAKLNYTLHRLQQATIALDSCPPNVDAAELAIMRADIALYSGKYRDAEETYSALVNARGTVSSYVRLGLAKKWLGAPGESSAFLEAAEKRYNAKAPMMLAWLKLQRGLVALDRGRFDEALAMYRLASDQMEGWWLVDEHIAEVLQLTGRTSEAKQLYENIVARTENPEFMDALASILHDEGQVEKAEKLTQRARAIYMKRLAEFPEATAGHALDHFLQNKDDPKFTLELAQKNVATRPYGEATYTLAKAWMLSGKPEHAESILKAQLASGWDTAEAYWLLGEAQSMLGQKAQAEKSKAMALARNPNSAEMYAFEQA